MNRGRRRSLICLVALAVSLGISAQDAERHRPRVGLVLSGGGARGSAHVGVLEVLEQDRVPVDIIVGTSMGAIVGGLYASGVSPKEMQAFLSETNWRDLLDDKPPRRHLPYRRKVEDQTYLTAFELGFNHGHFQLPPGLMSGQKLGFILHSMTLRAAAIENFDNLPIPFRAVATDLETGNAVVLDHGDLAMAMRASMSVPGVFSPIELDGRLLVDGGLVDNLPVDVARAMGADVVIAVDVGTPPLGKDELHSLSAVTGQILNLQGFRNAREQAVHADVLIRPALTGFGASQFERGEEMVPLGEAAAREATDALRPFSVSRDEYEKYRNRLRRPPSIEGARIQSVQLTQSSTADPRFVMRQIRTRPGEPLDLESIRQDLERLYETGDYERVDVRLVPFGPDFILMIEAIDKPWGPNTLRFGLNVVADLEGESSIDVLASYTMTKLDRYRGEIRIQTQLGEHPSVSAELYQPFELDQTWFGAVTLQHTTSTDWVPVGGGAYAPYRTDALLGLADLGYQLGRYGELRLGLVRGKQQSHLREGYADETTSFPRNVDSDIGGAHFTAILDQFDDMNFPRHGYFGLVDVFDSRSGLGGELDYDRLRAFLGAAGTHGRHTLLALSNFVSALGTDSPEVSELGGLFRLSGTPAGKVSGRYGGNLSLLYLYRLSDLPLGLGNGIYLGGSVEAGNLWSEANRVSAGDLHYAASVTIGADTVLGPLYLAQGFSEDGDRATYLYIGRTF